LISNTATDCGELAVRKLMLISLLAVLTPWADAQRGRFSGPHFGPSFGQHFGPYRSGYGRGYAAFPYFWDYPDDLLGAGYAAPAQPPIIVVQSPAAPQPAPEPIHSSAQPLLIELQGDRYVQIQGEDNSEAQMINRPSAKLEPGDTPNADSASAEQLPSVVLVFRDGHRENISNYTITNGVLFVQANYYTEGFWNKRIQLSSLDVPQTIDENRIRGVSFRLPAAPNQVMVGP
jgi:hypothetical protein